MQVSDELRLDWGASPLGPIGVVESAEGLVAIRVGWPELETLETWMKERYPQGRRCRSGVLRRLVAFARGNPDTFLDLSLCDGGQTPFGSRVIQACRAIPFGETASYKDLARAAGSPGAARAVGQVMATNSWPIVVPCHRVLRSDGSLGGYSVPLGLSFKERLLALEMRVASRR